MGKRNRPRAAGRVAEPPVTLSTPPRLVSDDKGQVVEVILDYADYKHFLRVLARHADWETLPSYLQDAIDNLLADEAVAEDGAPVTLRQALSETGDLPA